MGATDCKIRGDFIGHASETGYIEGFQVRVSRKEGGET
jgi:hypothetical protein